MFTWNHAELWQGVIFSFRDEEECAPYLLNFQKENFPRNLSHLASYRVCLANINFHNKRPGETSYDSLGKTEGDRGFRLLSVRGLKTLHVFLLRKYLIFIKYVSFWIIIAAIIICTCCYYSIIRADSDHMSFFPCRTNFIVHCNRFIKVSWYSFLSLYDFLYTLLLRITGSKIIIIVIILINNFQFILIKCNHGN